MSYAWRTRLAYMLAVITAASIAVLSLTESSHIPAVQVNDKLVHGLMYAVLAFFMMAGAVHNGHAAWLSTATVIGTATAYGALMELMQQWCTATRSGEWADVAADLIGAAAGAGIVWILYAVWKRTISTTSH